MIGVVALISICGGGGEEGRGGGGSVCMDWRLHSCYLSSCASVILKTTVHHSVRSSTL